MLNNEIPIRTLRLDTRPVRNGSMALFFSTGCAESDDMTWQPPEPKIVLKNRFGYITESGYTLAQLLAVRCEALNEAADMCEKRAVFCMLLSEIDQNFPLHQHHLGGEQAAKDLMRSIRKLGGLT
jgi:hypothetical protein